MQCYCGLDISELRAVPMPSPKQPRLANRERESTSCRVGWEGGLARWMEHAQLPRKHLNSLLLVSARASGKPAR